MELIKAYTTSNVLGKTIIKGQAVRVEYLDDSGRNRVRGTFYSYIHANQENSNDTIIIGFHHSEHGDLYKQIPLFMISKLSIVGGK